MDSYYRDEANQAVKKVIDASDAEQGIIVTEAHTSDLLAERIVQALEAIGAFDDHDGVEMLDSLCDECGAPMCIADSDDRLACSACGWSPNGDDEDDWGDDDRNERDDRDEDDDEDDDEFGKPD